MTFTGAESKRPPRHSPNGPRFSAGEAHGKEFIHSVLRIVGLTALFFILVAFLPLQARAESNDIPPLRYEVRDPLVPSDYTLMPFTLPPPQWQTIEQMSKSERRALLIQMAAVAVGKSVMENPITDLILAVREPIRTEDGLLSCRTRLTMKTYFMRCALKF